MSSLATTEFLASAINKQIAGKARRSNTGYLNICCPLCVTRGESPDRKYRGGIKITLTEVGYHCFNCGIKTRYTLGGLFSKTLKDFLIAIGIGEREVQKLSYLAFQIRKVALEAPKEVSIAPPPPIMQFPTVSLPEGARPMEEWAQEGCDDPNFIAVAQYMFSRGPAVSDTYTYYWAPSGPYGLARRLIVPLKYEGRIVGWAARAIDSDEERRYDSRVASNFLMNADTMKEASRKYIFLVEGVFDAIAIDGVGTLGAKLNGIQAHWINSFGKIVIVCPDRDKRGVDLIKIALANNWHVAFPRHGREQWWDSDVKDAADAAKRYGRIYALRSLIESAVSDPVKIRVLTSDIYGITI